MPVHDWTKVEAGIFHDFHTAWLLSIRTKLNGGLLPDGYYALAEQHIGRSIADVLTLHASPDDQLKSFSPQKPGGTAVAEAPPKVRHKQTVGHPLLKHRRTLAIRHVSGHRLIAIIEIVSPANKDRARSIDDFVAKVASALEADVHVLLIDLFPPGPHDPHGLHTVVQQYLEQSDAIYDLPVHEPITLASYARGVDIEVYLEHVGIGVPLPEMPLFLQHDRYVNVPLEASYLEAYHGMPSFWRDVLENKIDTR